MAREEESSYNGLIKKNKSDFIMSIVQFQASAIE